MQNNSNKKEQSYIQIVKSTAMIGGSSGINIVLRIIRMKVFAVLLGPTGVGLIGIYNSLVNILVTMAGMGIDSAGVRQIADSANAGNVENLERTKITLKRVSILLGLVGMLTFFLFREDIFRITFKNQNYNSDAAFLSIVVLFEIVMAGKIALIQGMRKIGDLAKIYILSALYGTLLSLPMIYFMGQKGIVPFLIASSALSTLTAWWYEKKINFTKIKISVPELWSETKQLLKLGFAMMASLLMYRATMYLLRILVARSLGLESVGLYLASTTLSYIYVGFIIDAMIKDYLPRLTAVANIPIECNKLVNEQVEIGALIAVPGILATLTVAPFIIQLFYTARFIGAYEILRWQILGCLLLIVAAPLGLILQAKSLGKHIFLSNLVINGLHIGLIYCGISLFGLKGTGIAFFIRCIINLFILYYIAKRLNGFEWSSANYKISLLTIPAVGIVFLSSLLLDNLHSILLGLLITIFATAYSIKNLMTLLGFNDYSILKKKLKGYLKARR